jgi:hypothetical protein
MQSSGGANSLNQRLDSGLGLGADSSNNTNAASDLSR